MGCCLKAKGDMSISPCPLLPVSDSKDSSSLNSSVYASTSTELSETNDIILDDEPINLILMYLRNGDKVQNTFS